MRKKKRVQYDFWVGSGLNKWLDRDTCALRLQIFEFSKEGGCLCMWTDLFVDIYGVSRDA